MRLLVTGAHGLLGRAVSRALAIRGDEDTKLDVIPWDRSKHGDFLVSVNRAACLKLIKPNAVLHLAWHSTSNPDYSKSSENRIWADATISFIEECATFGTWLIVAGSTADDSGRLASSTPYSLAKARIRDACLAANPHLPLTYLRLHHLVSISEYRPHVLRTLMQDCHSEGLELRNPDSLHDFIDIRDAATAIETVLRNPAERVVEIASGTRRSVAQLLAAAIKHDTTFSTMAEILRHKTDGISHPVEQVDVTWLRNRGWTPEYSDQLFDL